MRWTVHISTKNWEKTRESIVKAKSELEATEKVRLKINEGIDYVQRLD